MLTGLVFTLGLFAAPVTVMPTSPAPAPTPVSYIDRDGIHFVTSTPRPAPLVNDAQSRYDSAIFGNRYALPPFTRK
jgi:hypothetical protein